MKRAIFIFLWLSYSVLSFAQTEVGTIALPSQKDTTEIVGSTIPEAPIISTDYIRPYPYLSNYNPTFLLSNNSYLGTYATYSETNMNWEQASEKSLPSWIVFTANTQDYPGLMRTESGSIGVSGQKGNFGYNAYAGAVKYATFNSLETSYFIGGQASYTFNPKLSLTVFGTYYSRNPYFGMAAYPYIQTTNFGGYMTISPNSTFSLSLGAKSYYDPFARRMEVDPIIAPTVKVGKVRVVVDVGHAAKSYIRSLIQSRNK